MNKPIFEETVILNPEALLDLTGYAVKSSWLDMIIEHNGEKINLDDQDQYDIEMEKLRQKLTVVLLSKYNKNFKTSEISTEPRCLAPEYKSKCEYNVILTKTFESET